jgi:zona occludens toxin (predicted ATPase)
MLMNIQEAYRSPNSLDQKRNTSCHIIIKTPNAQNKERMLKAVREKSQVTYKSRPIRIIRLLTRDYENQKILGTCHTDPKRAQMAVKATLVYCLCTNTMEFLSLLLCSTASGWG